jgi:hypothetical protein
VLSTIAYGGIIATVLGRLHVVSTPDRARPLALVFLLVGVALATSAALHLSLGYSSQEARVATDWQRRDACDLARALKYEAWLAAYFLIAWIVERALSSETLEFALAVLGYVAFLLVCGRIHALAASVDRPSISTAILRSRAVQDVKRGLNPWAKAGRDDTTPPGVTKASILLSVLPRVGQASALMSVLATLVAGVAVANAGPALESAGEVANGLVAADSAPPKARDAGRASLVRPPVRTGPDRPAPSPVAPPQAVTFTARCGRDHEPGRGAPAPIDDKLRQLWLGRLGVGALIGGCPDRARRVEPESSVWYSAGRDGEPVVSLGVVAADGTSALLLGEPARFALNRAVDGSLVRASARARVAHGDLEVVDTQLGSFVFVREELRHGLLSVPYTVLPPGLARIWLLAVRAKGWTWPELEHVRDGTTVFSFTSETGRIVGAATCTSETWCSSTIHGVVASTGFGDRVTLRQLAAVAPAAAQP